MQVDAFKGRIARLAADLGRNRLPQLPEGAPPEAVLRVKSICLVSSDSDSCALLILDFNRVPQPVRHWW